MDVMEGSLLWQLCIARTRRLFGTRRLIEVLP